MEGLRVTRNPSFRTTLTGSTIIAFELGSHTGITSFDGPSIEISRTSCTKCLALRMICLVSKKKIATEVGYGSARNASSREEGRSDIPSVERPRAFRASELAFIAIYARSMLISKSKMHKNLKN